VVTLSKTYPSKEGIQSELQHEKEREHELQILFMKHEAKKRELKNEQKKLRRDQKKIEQSRLWKYTAVWRKTITVCKNIKTAFLGKAKQELIQENEQLHLELRELRQQLMNVEQKLINETHKANDRLIALGEMDRDHLLHSVKRAKEQGQMVEYMRRLIESKTSIQNAYREALFLSARHYQNEKQDVKAPIFQEALSGLHAEEVPEFIVREVDEKETISLKSIASFRANLSIRLRKKQFGTILPEWLLDQKKVAYRFMDSLHIDRPWVSDDTYTISTIPKKERIVIKPQDGAGSRGVYLVFTEGNILDVKRSKTLNSWESLIESMKEDLDSRSVKEDSWMIEELLLEDKDTFRPARDLKFYCFYGKVAIILEVQRFPELSYCWWTADGKQITTGKYDGDLFKGVGASEQEVQLAACISSEIPVPFIRIDFLKTSRGLVFGEFTPKPGNYDEFNRETDRWLGDEFLSAEERLISDLLNGKSFESFKNLLDARLN
jgi:hypothetical protein